MRKKKLDVYERQKLERRQAFFRAAPLKEEYPHLAKLTIDLSFKTYDDWVDNPSPKQEFYGPDNKAFFEVECPFRECVDGGFNLSVAVSEMVANGKTETCGTITCQGWQDKERIGKNRCRLEMNYNITATYN